MSGPLSRNALRKLRAIAAPLGREVPAGLAFGKYRIVREIGGGAVGKVYEAEDPDLGRPVALKILAGPFHNIPTARERFLREGRSMAGLSHPNVVSVHDVGEEKGQMYLVMELVDGRPLSDRIRTGEHAENVRLLEKAARGVAAAHGRGIVHRDLKPENILVGRDGEPKVADFGLAHWEEAGTELTRPGAAIGTPRYMAPEQVGTGERISPRTDVFALGVILYQMIAGRPPFDAASTTDLFMQILKEDPPAPHTVRAGVPRDLETICLKAMDKEPDRRYPSAAEFADDLRRFLDGEAIVARGTSVIYRVRKRVGRHRKLLAVSAAVGVAGLVIGALIFSNGRGGALRDEVSAVLKEADGFSRAAETEAAARVLDRGIALCREKGGTAEAQYLLGKLLAGRGWRHAREAERAFTRALELDPGRTEARIERGLLRLATYRGDLDRYTLAWERSGEIPMRGRPDWDALIEKTPELKELRDLALEDLSTPPGEGSRLDPVVVRYGQAELARLLGRRAEAMAGLTEVTESAPLFERAWLALARLRMGSGQYDLAVEHATKATDVHRGYAEAYLVRARLYVGQAERAGNPRDLYRDARKDCDRAIQLGMDSPAAYHFRGMARHGLGDPEGALADYSRALELSPSEHETYYNRGIVHGELGREEEAVADYGEAIRLCPRHAAARNNRSILLRKRGDTEGAMRDLDEALRLRPDYGLAWYNRGNLLLQLERPREAIGSFDVALKHRAEDARIYLQRGNARHGLGEFGLAAEDYTSALQLDPDLAAAWNNRGLCRMRLGKPGPAAKDFSEAILRDPGYVNARLNRAFLYLSQEEWEKALPDLDEVIRTAPRSAKAWYFRAKAHYRLGRREAAMRDARKALEVVPADSPQQEELEEMLRSLEKRPRF